MCFFAALIEGLRMVNERIRARPELEERFNPNALIDYAQEKGKDLVILLYPERAQLDAALARVVWQPTPAADGRIQGRPWSKKRRWDARPIRRRPGHVAS